MTAESDRAPPSTAKVARAVEAVTELLALDESEAMRLQGAIEVALGPRPERACLAEVPLMPMQWKILRLLIAAGPRVSAHGSLMDAAGSDGTPHTATVHVRLIRRALGEKGREWLLNEHGAGYVWAGPTAEETIAHMRQVALENAK